MQPILFDPHSPNFFHSASIYQDVPGLQLAKCTYAGMRTDSRRKSLSICSLKLSENNPTCALGGAFRGGWRRQRRPWWVSQPAEMGRKRAENGRFGRGLSRDPDPGWRDRRAECSRSPARQPRSRGGFRPRSRGAVFAVDRQGTRGLLAGTGSSAGRRLDGRPSVRLPGRAGVPRSVGFTAPGSRYPCSGLPSARARRGSGAR